MGSNRAYEKICRLYYTVLIQRKHVNQGITVPAYAGQEKKNSEDAAYSGCVHERKNRLGRIVCVCT